LKVQRLSKRLEIAGIIGLIAPFFSFACIILAIASWTQFSWANNALSDLGVQNGTTSSIFNIGLVVTGILFIIFAIGLYSFAGKQLLGKGGVMVFFLACMALIAIGVFNESFSPTHYIVSVTFFVFLPISMLIFVGAFWRDGKHKLSMFTLVIGLAAATPWILQFAINYVSKVAIPEFASGLAGSAWVIVLAYIMLKKAEQPASK
jgi:hypothetical membrane protein